MRPITLMGMIDGNRTSYMVKEDRYQKRDFVWLAAFLLEKYRGKIAPAEGQSVTDDALKITFSFINANGEKRTISNASERVDQYYKDCEGRLYWDYALAPAATPSQCPQCGKVVSGTGKFCPYCGCKRVLMCGQCSCELVSDMLFCPKCGCETVESLVRKGEEALSENAYYRAKEFFQKALSEDADNARARSRLTESVNRMVADRRKEDEAFLDGFSKDQRGIVTDIWGGLEWYVGPDKNTSWNEAKHWVENLNVDGGGWRMPTYDELNDLKIWEEGDWQLPPAFKTTGDRVWVEPEIVEDSVGKFLNGVGTRERIWYRLPSCVLGDINYGDRNERKGRAFAVRSTRNFEMFLARFSKNQKGMIVDAEKGHEWYVGPDKDTNWNEAKHWVENLNVDGGGWRMPTRSELIRFYHNGVNHMNMHPIIKTTGRCFWSGERKGSEHACIIRFDSEQFFMIWDHRLCDDSFRARAFAVRSRI